MEVVDLKFVNPNAAHWEVKPELGLNILVNW